MSKVAIAMAEKRLMRHLQRGGVVDDPVGLDLTRGVIAKASADNDVQQVIRDREATPDEMRVMYQFVIDGLMPNPCMNVSGPMLVPTVLFLEPHRLDELLVGVNRDTRGESLQGRMRLLCERALEVCKLTREAHDEAHGPIAFQVTPQGGVQRAGCAGGLILCLTAIGWFLG